MRDEDIWWVASVVVIVPLTLAACALKAWVIQKAQGSKNKTKDCIPQYAPVIQVDILQAGHEGEDGGRV